MGVAREDAAGVVWSAIGMARARLAKLAEREGCAVRLCGGDSCWDGVLEEVDTEAAVAALRDPVSGALTIVAVDVSNLEVHVYRCPDNDDRADGEAQAQRERG